MFTRLMVAITSKSFTVDSDRIYAMGWSNGGYMSERLGCEAADLFAGIGADASAIVIGANNVSGLADCDRSFGASFINYIHYSGTADNTVPWTGGGSNHENLPSALEDFSRWGRRNGCSASLEQTYNDLAVFSNLVLRDCRGGTEMELMTVRGGVHQWWTGPVGGFNTTDYTLAFFTRTYTKQPAVKSNKYSHALH